MEDLSEMAKSTLPDRIVFNFLAKKIIVWAQHKPRISVSRYAQRFPALVASRPLLFMLAVTPCAPNTPVYAPPQATRAAC